MRACGGTSRSCGSLEQRGWTLGKQTAELVGKEEGVDVCERRGERRVCIEAGSLLCLGFGSLKSTENNGV